MKYLYKVLIIISFFSSCASSNLLEKEMVLYEIENFNIYHEGENEQTLADITEVLTISYNVVIDFFGILPEKTDIYFYRDQKTFQSKKYPVAIKFVNVPWYIGDNIGESALAVSPRTLTDSGYRTYEQNLYVIGHEYIHTIIYRINNDCNLWINEGMALFLINGNRSKNILKYREIPQVSIFRNNNPITFSNNGGYEFADKFIEYVFNNYGIEKVFELIHNNNYEEVLGKKMSNIYEEWVKYLKENYNNE